MTTEVLLVTKLNYDLDGASWLLQVGLNMISCWSSRARYKRRAGKGVGLGANTDG